MQENHKLEILFGLKKYLPEMIALNKKELKKKYPQYFWSAVMVDLWNWEFEETKYPGMTQMYISTIDTQNWRLQFRDGNSKEICLEKGMTTEELFDLIRPSIQFVCGIRTAPQIYD
ncbi:hypothetical protein WKH56_08370 [Priestia sp. SB1]|uniref:Uncharacterized protein n=1 Tax=Priestia aryabhattai TaxID=412384 RepID=A0AAX6NDR0_PRIAR|nr:hypothetical protein [Priestia aryabhattai]MDU9694041.1 hypothetical protein [Priestia aryabhattai]